MSMDGGPSSLRIILRDNYLEAFGNNEKRGSSVACLHHALSLRAGRSLLSIISDGTCCTI